MSAPIGIFLGRIANFINSELYGRESDLFWSVKFERIDNAFIKVGKSFLSVNDAAESNTFLFVLKSVFGISKL